MDLRFLWAMESIGITDSPKTTREEEAIKQFNEDVKFEDQRYLPSQVAMDRLPTTSANSNFV